MTRILTPATVALALIGSAGLSLASPIIYTAHLSGPAEDPPNASPGTGSATVTFDELAHTLRVEVAFSGLLGATTVAHIHGPTALPLTGLSSVATQVPTFAGFPAGVTSGTYDNTFDLTDPSSFNPTFLNAQGGDEALAEAALAEALADGKAYLNIHTNLFGAGEIRGFLTPVVPEPATVCLVALGGLAVLGARRRLRR